MNWVSKLKKKVKAYLAKEKKTVRTKAVTKGLKAAGVTQEEIDRLSGKKKPNASSK